MAWLDVDRFIFAIGCGVAMLLLCGANRRSFGLAILSSVLTWLYSDVVAVIAVAGVTFFFVSREVIRLREKNRPPSKIIDGTCRVIDANGNSS